MSSKRLKLYRKLFFLVSLPSSTSGSVFDFSASLLLITFLAVWSISLFHRCEENDIDDFWPSLLIKILKNKKKLCFTAGKDCRQRNIAGNHTNVIEGVKYAYIIKIKLYLYTLIENICIKDTKCGCYHPELIIFYLFFLRRKLEYPVKPIVLII
jgi:hypothetical protein